MLSFFPRKWKQIQIWIKTVVFKTIRLSFRKNILEHPVCKMLCVDDDRSFCLFMQQLAYSLGIQLDTVYSIQQAKRVIEKDVQYKAFIIDGHLPDGSGFELVAWIREKKKFAFPIVFISRIYHDAGSFRILKERFKVDYVLEKPIQSAEVCQLFIQICQLTASRSVTQEPCSELLTDLRNSYQKTISDKIERLEKMILDVQKNPSIENAQILRGEVHKIAGSAGSYGYMTVSNLCKNLELDLIKQIDSAEQRQISHQWLALLDDFFTQIKIGFQMKIPELEYPSSFRKEFLSLVYVVDDNQDFLHHFKESIRDLNFEVLTESIPEKAIQTFLAADFYPQILLVNAHYSFPSSLTGYELVKFFYQRNDELTNVIALMVETQGLKDQIEAFQRGMSIILTKPFSPSLLLPLLDQIPFRSLALSYKILVLDDDLDVYPYILKSLKYPGLEIEAPRDFSDLKNVIKSYQPDLILLDINPTNEDTVTILHQIRNKCKYKKTLVGIVAVTQQETQLLQQCYEAGMDEILFKPLEGGILQRKIALLFKKKVNEILFTKQASKTNVGSLKTFKKYLNELQYRPCSPSLKLLVVFELKELKSASSKIKKEALKYISQSFENLLNKYEIVVALGKESFGLIFQGYHPNFVQLFMHDFLLNIHSYLQNNLIEGSFYFHEALLILPKEEDPIRILERSKELLLLAHQQPQQPVCLVNDPSFISPKEVLILYENEQSVNFIQILFRKLGFKVSLYSDFSTFEETSQLQFSFSLFILADSFATTKGLPLLKKIFQQHHVQVPILYLPTLPVEEDLKRLLKEINYFDSPFSLVIILS